jgi:hypothetical protein
MARAHRSTLPRMAETPARSNGFRWPRTGLPARLLVLAVVLALVIVSGLIALLYEETRGPGEVLRQFAHEVDSADCAGSYELLDESVRAEFDEERWCDMQIVVDRIIDEDFTLDQAVLREDTAILMISGSIQHTWELRRFGERSWRVLGPPGGF